MASFDAADQAAIDADVRVGRELEQGRQVWWQHGIDSRRHARRLIEIPCEGSLVFDRGIYPPLRVDLFDTSSGGACLLTPHRLDVLRGEQAALRLSGRDDQRVWVCWSEVRDQITAMGVAFSNAISREK